jgi:hypothetical protein
MLVAVVTIGVLGRTTNAPADDTPVASSVVLVAHGAPPREAVVVTPSPRSDWPATLAERVNKFTIDDQVVSWSRLDDVPRRTHRVGGLAKY